MAILRFIIVVEGLVMQAQAHQQVHNNTQSLVYKTKSGSLQKKKRTINC